jgi:hypothetical protein
MLYDFVLSLQVFVVICAFVLASAIHTCELLMRRATTVAELRTLAKPGKFGPVFGVIVLLLFGLGSWLVHLSPGDEKFHYKDPFIWTSIVVLAFLFVTGPTVLGRHQRHLEKAIEATPEGPIPDELRTTALSPLGMYVGNISTLIALGVVFNMANKPGTAVCLIVIGGGVLVGALFGWLMTRPVHSTLAAPAKASV